MKKSLVRKWLVMLILSVSASSIYLLPFLQEVYYRPLADALQLNNTQVGSLMSIYGTFAMLTYFPGGWVADKVIPRYLISISLITTGLIGLYFATLPSYEISLIIQFFSIYFGLLHQSVVTVNLFIAFLHDLIFISDETEKWLDTGGDRGLMTSHIVAK